MKIKLNKKYILPLLFLQIFLHPLFGNEAKLSLPEKFQEFTLENSLKVFVLEDFSTAPVRIELTVRSGFSAQTPKTAGFFPLYVKLFAEAGLANAGFSNENKNKVDWYLKYLQSECNADCSRFIITAAPQQVEQVLALLSSSLFSPIITDQALTQEFSRLKSQVMQNAFSTAGFINSSIDSRVFAKEPWKQDSGIYPAIFTNTPMEGCRTILSSIARNYYNSQNTALFISGGISRNKALELSKKYFNRISPSSAGILSDSQASITPSKQKKFILHDPLFSPEMTQIVIQYTGLTMEQSDVAAVILDEYNSPFKQQLTKTTELSIRGREYINVASAHKNGSSRLIFQSLLEKNKNVSPVKQTELFVNSVKNADSQFTDENSQKAKEKLVSQFRTRFKNSSAFMELLSQFWAITNISDMHSENTSQELILQPEIIQKANIQELLKAYGDDEPFVFVLMNSEIYKKNAGGFKRSGYEEITAKNGSWYSQKLYDSLKKLLSEEPEIHHEEKEDFNTLQIKAAQAFAEENEKQFSSFRLSNKIPVIIKRNPNAATAVISLAISGGKLSTAKINNGLSEVMINALARNIQYDISKGIAELKISGDPEVLSESNLAGGIITVECLENDVQACLSCISNAIIYGNIKPAEADGLIYDRRSQHRIQRGSPEYQLYCNAIKLLYSETEYPFVFTAQEEILAHTQYMEILGAYPGLLNAARYSLVLTGNIPQKGLKPLLENSFGILANQEENEFRLYHKFPNPDFSFAKSKNKPHLIQLEHQFLMDLSSEPAGPRPPILIPTTEFFDPLQYWLPSPPVSSEDFVLFNAILYELEERLSKALMESQENENTEVKIQPATAEIQAAVITFTNVHHTKKIDELFAKTVKAALEQNQDESITNQIKDRWILKTLAKTQTNRGTALLLRTGLEAGNIESSGKNDRIENVEADTHILAAQRYIQEYEIISKADGWDFLRTAKKYIPEQAPLRLYSKDSKK